MAGLQEGALAGLGLGLQGKIHHPNSCFRWMLQTEATTEQRCSTGWQQAAMHQRSPAERETAELIPAQHLRGAFKGRSGERSSSRSSRVKDCGWRVCKPHLEQEPTDVRQGY